MGMETILRSYLLSFHKKYSKGKKIVQHCLINDNEGNKNRSKQNTEEHL